MSEDNDKLGKKYRGQTSVPIKTADDVQAEIDAQVPYNKPQAISLGTYFAVKGFRRPETQAGMSAYTKVRSATVEDWDAIFASF